MKLSSRIVNAGVLAAAGVSAFAPSHPSLQRPNNNNASPAPITELSTSTYNNYDSDSTTTRDDLIDITDEYTPRDIYSMEQWAYQNGIQKYDGIELHPTDGESTHDMQLVNTASTSIPAGSPVIFVPANFVLSSNNIADEFGGSLEAAENELVQLDRNTEKRLPLFRLMVKLMAEYDEGMDSVFYPWLNSLPRQFYNGVSMTDECFECLPPYAAMLSMSEKETYNQFVDVIRDGYVPVEENTMNDDRIVSWAYNVALTRFHEVWYPTRQKLIAPMADMLNHSSEPNVEITFDAEGNCIVQSLREVQPGSPLTISLGDPTNPTPLFAKYGFLPNDCNTIFCKALHLETQRVELGYDYRDLLFDTQTGHIAPKVWDIFLYELLQNSDDASATEQFYVACKSNDEGTKQQYHEHYFQYTLDALKQHVYSILQDVDRLTAKAQSYDVWAHPRVPIIVAHNNLVRDTFTMAASMLEQMG
mmetsp:Transcript_8624/g.18222  ORF Transcript_8624/g.18222 Transcript_8624/m.18222 type:complete len:474 (-) Transcript_8624:470-1891(-)